MAPSTAVPSTAVPSTAVPSPSRSGAPPELTNRRIAGVAGGLGDYLGVDATALRVGFVLASLLFLGGIGGPLLYAAAWIFVPEEGRAAAHVPNLFRGRRGRTGDGTYR